MLVEISVDSDYAGQRAERFLRQRLPRLGMGRLQSLFRRREIKVARRPVDRAYRLAAGDLIQVYGLRPEEADAGTVPEAGMGGPALPMPAVLFEDDDLLVVDKPAGMTAHPGTGIAPGASLIERVRARPASGARRFPPSLAHRLDKETSGVLLVAKSGPRLRSLAEALRAGRLRKRYLALVAGVPEPAEGVIETPLKREDSAAGAKSVAGGEGGKRAVSRYRVLERFGSYALLQVIIETGRMHQIRAHLAHLGHPVAGDTRYHRPGEARRQQKELGLGRLFLHAEETAWDENGRTWRFQAPLPSELRAALARLAGSGEA